MSQNHRRDTPVINPTKNRSLFEVPRNCCASCCWKSGGGAERRQTLPERQGVFIRPLADRYEEVVATYVGPDSQSSSERQCVDPRLGRRCATSRDSRRH